MKLQTAFKLYLLVLVYMIAHLALVVRDVSAEPLGDAVRAHDRYRAEQAQRYDMELQRQEMRDMSEDAWAAGNAAEIGAQRRANDAWLMHNIDRLGRESD